MSDVSDFELALAEARVGLVTLQGSQILNLSSGAEKLLGCATGEFVNQPLQSIIGESQANSVRESLEQSGSFRGKLLLSGSQSKPLPVQLTATSTGDKSQVVIQEIAETEESRSFLELVKNEIPDLLFVKDRDYRIVEANPAFLSVYPEEMRERVIGFTTVEEYDEKDAAAFLEQDRLAFETGYSEVIEAINFPDGKVRLLSTKKIRFHNSQGEPFILGIARDVTEREQLIQRLTDSNQELQRFAFICSHDLQEPLRMVGSFTELLEQHLKDVLADDERGKQYFRFVTEGAERARQLIAEILEYSRVDSSTTPFQEVCINDLVERLKETFRHELEGAGGQIVTTNQLPKLEGNRARLFQLFNNLVGNAIKYRQPDVPLRIEIDAELKGDSWEFVLKDNGIGIEPKHHDRIFLIFQRLHTRKKYPGTGIGLALCRKVVEHHGGRIWVDSTLGGGSKFYFTLRKIQGDDIDGIRN